MPKKSGRRGPRPLTNPDLRHRSHMPGPEIKEIERRLYALLSPSLLAPRQMERRNPKDPWSTDQDEGAAVNPAGDDGDHCKSGLSASLFVSRGPAAPGS